MTTPGGGYLSAGTEAFRAGVDGTELEYDRLRVNENGNFIWSDKTRAEIMARDYIVGLGGRPTEEVLRRLNSSEYDALVTKIKDYLSDSRIFPNGAALPNNLADLDEKVVAATVRLEGEDAAFAKRGQLWKALRAADPIGFDAAMAANDGLAGQFLKATEGSVNPKFGLAAAGLALSGLFTYTQYKAETLDTPGKSFTDWAAEKTPQFLATLPFAAGVLGGLTFLARIHPLGMAFTIALGAVGGYEAFKTFMDNYVKAHASTPDDPFVSVFKTISGGIDAFEKLPAISAIINLFNNFAHVAVEPIARWATPQVSTYTGEAVGLSIDPGEWLIGKEAATIFGYKGDDGKPDDKSRNKLFHFGYGEAYGGEGNDWLIGWRPEYVAKGEYLLESDRAKAKQNETLPEDQRVQLDGPKAEKDYRLKLDGGAGDDTIVVLGGKGAIAVGGEGKDFVFNTSYKGQLYGDSIDGTGEKSTNVFWWSAGSFIMDAGKEDILQLFGLPLTGGTNSIFGIPTGQTKLAFDWLLPFVFYGFSKSKQLIVYSAFSDILDGSFDGIVGGEKALSSSMLVENFDFGEGGNWAHSPRGDLNMTFRILAHDKNGMNLLYAVFGQLISWLDAIKNFAKMLQWKTPDDPLVLDLDGDGIETSSLTQGGVHFDMDGDGFAEMSGWVGADDGLLVLDRDGNGKIDDISELFGAPGGSGFGELRLLDDDASGVIDAGDVVFDKLQVWRDLNQDGVSQTGELFSLDELGITSIDAIGAPLNVTAPSGTLLRETATFTRADGSTGNIFEAIFETNPIDTVFRGDRGTADWVIKNAMGAAFDAKGYGKLASLSAHLSNDLVLSDTVRATAAAMTTPDLATLRKQAAPVLEQWGASLAGMSPKTDIMEYGHAV